jgi:hypothetical protein
VSEKIRDAAKHYVKVYQDYDEFDGDRRGIRCALWAAQHQLAKAVVEDLIDEKFPEDET